MKTPSTYLAWLDHETRAHHPDADSPWLTLLAMELTRERYIDLLITIYGFEAPLEAALALTSRVPPVLQLRQRARAGRIVQDLLALGLSASGIARLPQCGSFAMFSDPAEALGWAYVVERTTRLHEPLRRQVARRISPSACAYLAAATGEVEARWRALGDALDRVTETPAIAEQILDAAHAAFTCQRSWFLGEPCAAARGA